MPIARDQDDCRDALALRDRRFRAIPTFDTLAEIIAFNRRQFGAYDALFFRERRISNVSLFDDALKFAGVLQGAGIRRGDRVVVNLANCVDIWLAYFACTALKAVMVPTVPSWTAEELAFVVTDCAASAVLTSEDKAAWIAARRADFPALMFLHPIAPCHDSLNSLFERAAPLPTYTSQEQGDLAAIIYTSGTTGKPKGVMLSQQNLCRQACLNLGFYVGPGEDSRIATILMALPMCHVFGIAVALTALLMGNPMVVMERFEPTLALSLIATHKVRIVPAVPTMLGRLLAEPSAKSSCGSVMQWDCGGSALPVEIMQRVERELGGVCTEGWGMSETSSAVAQNVPDVPQKTGSVGLALPGLELAVRASDGRNCAPNESGELLVRGATVMLGYWERAAATARALDAQGFLHSGDIGYLDADGYCYIVGRKDDLIIRGGENISPREIEEVIQSLPAVKEVAVVGLLHQDLGQIPVAFVVAADMSLQVDDIITLCRARLARFKVPARVELLAELPHNATGKVIKEELKRRYSGTETRSV